LFEETEFVLNMIWRYNLKLICTVLFMNLCVNQSGFAQNSSIEFWPETDIWYRLNPSWRLSAFIPITKYNESKNRDLNIYLHIDYAWGHTKHIIHRRLVDQEKEQIMKIWMVRGGFMEGRSLGENAGNYIEDMLFAEIHRRIPIQGDFLLSHRFRFDTRWLGQDNDFSYRLRYRLMVEKEYKSGNYSIVPYLNIEPYWDSRYSKITKTRAIGGVTTNWGSKFALEGNVTYQYDQTYDTETLYALNIILHIFFER
jgi:hypothetical protein